MHAGIPGISDIAYMSPVTLDSASDDVALQLAAPQVVEQVTPVSPSVHPEGELCVVEKGVFVLFWEDPRSREHT